MLTALMNDVVQGPEKTARHGRTLFIRPTLPGGRPGSFPSQAVVVTAAARRLIELSKGGEKLDSVVVTGAVDPTLHPEFREISQNLRELCDKWFSKANLVLLSDSLGLHRPEVRQSLSIYDKPVVRLEAGSQKTYASLTGNKPATYKGVVESLSKVELERIIVQAKFVRGKADNSTDAELRSWLKQLGTVAPGQVQVYTLAKADAKSGLKPITAARLEAIANQVADKTGIPVEIVSA